MKTCPACRRPQPLYLFGRSRNTADGLSIECLRCRASETPTAAPPKRASLDPQQLIEFRARYGFSQTGAANALGCSTMSISNWERGANAIPHTVRLAMSAFVAGLPPYGA